jgi:hypothetical protein
LATDRPDLVKAFPCKKWLVPTEDQLRWAEALKIEQIHGDSAPVWVAERKRALALAGDTAGVERFRQIAARLGQLRATLQSLPANRPALIQIS